MEWFQQTHTGLVLSWDSRSLKFRVMGLWRGVGRASPSLWTTTLTTGVLMTGRVGSLGMCRAPDKFTTTNIYQMIFFLDIVIKATQSIGTILVISRYQKMFYLSVLADIKNLLKPISRQHIRSKKKHPFVNYIYIYIISISTSYL